MFQQYFIVANTLNNTSVMRPALIMNYSLLYFSLTELLLEVII